MPDISDALSTIAEFSIGLAGFTGIIAAVFNRAAAPVTQFRFMNLLLTSFAPGFFALLTVAALLSGVEADRVVRIASAFLAIYLAGSGVFAVNAIRRLPVGDAGIDNRISWIFRITVISNMALQAANAAFGPGFCQGIFVFGLTVLLMLGAIQFATLALAVLRERATTR